ncbi:hypothetical protein L596_011749 [Steinernema carpocapsae]|nr:hypothetical protein L596_011749 [Steinernema carpocapsae]
MRQDLASLRHLHPDYEVWVTGHSLGAAMASLAAGTIVAEGVVPDSQLKLMTFGQPRTGDKEYAHFIDSRISYKFRVVHAQDIIPHMPFKLIWGYKHHRSEIWYNNDMTTNSTFVGCEEADGNACSNSQVALSWPDHMHYFNIHIFDFGKNGCKY